jgi:hypothetical protein
LWLYVNPTGALLGPFSSNHMRAWFRAGLLGAILPVKPYGTAGPFRALHCWFPSRVEGAKEATVSLCVLLRGTSASMYCTCFARF